MSKETYLLCHTSNDFWFSNLYERQYAFKQLLEGETIKRDFIATNILFNDKIMILKYFIKEKQNASSSLKSFFYKKFYSRFLELKKPNKEYWGVLNINVLLKKIF